MLWFCENLVNIGKVWSRIDEKVGERPCVNWSMMTAVVVENISQIGKVWSGR